MDSKKIVENIFKNNGITFNVKDVDNYIDPKCKTSSSIYSKLLRLYSNSENKTKYTILNSGIKDLLRMTIIVEYKDVISTIKKLKQRFPDLTGYLKIKQSGYRGIHLNLKIDGISCEIQLAPKILIMAREYLHSLHEKWRDFDYDNELGILKQKEILNNNNNIEDKISLLKMFEEEKNRLQIKSEEEKKDFNLRCNTYKEIYDVTKFSYYHDDIKKEIEELNKQRDESLPLTNKKLINIFNTNLITNGCLDKEKVKQVAEQIPDNISSIQEKFVDLVKECLELE